MTDQTKMRVIKTVLLIGILADALWAVALVYPRLYGILIGIPDFQPDLDFRLAMGIGASLMAGWTVLLAWTLRKPIERRGVMILTVAPVLAGLFIVTICGFIYGGSSNYWILSKLVILAAAMLTSYHWANTMAKEAADAIGN